MGKHIPVVEEGWAFECIEGDCEHESDDQCVVPVVACAGCLEKAQSGAANDEFADGMFDIPEWPCIESTHYGEPAMSDLKAQLLADWHAKREPAESCRIETVDDEPVRVHGSGDWDNEDRAAFTEIVRAAKRHFRDSSPDSGAAVKL